MQTLRKGIVMTTLGLCYTAGLAPGLALAQPAKAAPAAPTAPATRNEAGKIELVNGAVVITGADRTRRTPKQGDLLYEGDAVATGADGELQAEMMDSGVIAIRPNTEMSITKYQAEGTSTDTSIFGLVKGSFRSITGWIGKNNPTRYRINTPTATVGVRGTDHEPLVIPAGSTTGEPGTYDKVAAGRSFIEGKTGRVDVTPGRTGFFSHTARERPRVLAANPTFYRPTRNEARLEGRHERLRPVLEQRRTERQTFVRERMQQRNQQGGPGRPGAQGGPGAGARGAAPGAPGAGMQQRRDEAAARRAATQQGQPGQPGARAQAGQQGGQQQTQSPRQQALERRQEAQNQRQQSQAQTQQHQQAQAQQRQQAQAQAQQRQQANQQNADERRRKAEELRKEREQQRGQRQQQHRQ